jgi:hypothetical protein
LSATNKEKIEYIHPLSQLVLEHLQKSRSEWIEAMHLDKGLKLNEDGTFVLENSHDIKIWTYFDAEEKKHFLGCRKGELVGKVILQDNLKPAWNDAQSTPEKIQEAVEGMIDKMDAEG